MTHPSDPSPAERIARMFHDAYERLAPEFGYTTRRESAVPWERVPVENRRLMVAVAGEVMAAVAAEAMPARYITAMPSVVDLPELVAAAAGGSGMPSIEYQSGRSPGGLTTDPDDPRLTHGVDTSPTPQAEVYLVMDPTTAKPHRPVRTAYRHVDGCGAVTTMTLGIAETYARDPKFYGSTYCTRCRMHRPVSEFEWVPFPGETIPVEQRRVGS